MIGSMTAQAVRVVCKTAYVVHGCVLDGKVSARVRDLGPDLDLPPIVSFDKHAGNVGPPIASNPPQALFEVLGTVF